MAGQWCRSTGSVIVVVVVVVVIIDTSPAVGGDLSSARHPALRLSSSRHTALHLRGS